MDTHERLAFESNVAMFCAVFLVLRILLCCWMVPILVRNCTNRSNSPQPHDEEAIEMEEVNRGIHVNRENTSLEQGIEQFDREMNQENSTHET